MKEVTIQIPDGTDLGGIPPKAWARGFQRHVDKMFEELGEVEEIVKRSNATPEQIEELTASIRKGVADRYFGT